MDGFQKIDLETNTEIPDANKEEVKEMVHKKSRFKNLIKSKKAKVALGVLLFLILFSIFGVILPANATLNSAQKTIAQARIAADAVKKQNVDLASVELVKTKEELISTQKSLNRMGYFAYIPFVNAYYNDAKHLVNAGFNGLNASMIMVDAVKPYADILGLKGQGSFVMGSAETRVQTAVTTMGKITPKIDEIADELNKAKEEIDDVDPNRYPSFLVGKKLRENIDQAKKLTDNGVTYINDAKPLIKVLPEILGEPDEKKYLVLFQNDKELRPTGGFITAYAVFRFDKGIVHVDTSSDIYELDGTIPGKPTAPKPLLQYLPKVPKLNLRDTNLSPDFVESMKEFNKLYEKAPSAQEVDGIIAVDTRALVAAMNILGDIETNGVKFTTEIDPRCDCPQVVYMLEVIADQPVQGIRTDRKGIIGDLMYAIMNKAFSSSPKLYWGPLFQEMLTQTAQKHILFYSYNKNAQSGFESLNASGRIMDFEGDYFHINGANFGGAKSNMFVSKAVDQNYDIKDDGSITKTVTVNYKNPYPPSDCNLERGNLCLNAVLRNWFRVYVPKGSELIDVKGSEVKVTSYDELGKTVFDGFLTVRPKGSAKLTITYKLPFKLEKGSPLPLLIQKQPGIEGFEYTISNKGKQIDKFELLTDKELKLSLPR
ncbi:MAG: DUF4012 domain-containing protein [Candidatus Levyibacteriota bacterium]